MGCVKLKILCKSVLKAREYELIEQLRYLCLVCKLMQQSVRLDMLKSEQWWSGEFLERIRIGYEIGSFDSCE